MKPLLIVFISFLKAIIKYLFLKEFSGPFSTLFVLSAHFHSENFAYNRPIACNASIHFKSVKKCSLGRIINFRFAHLCIHPNGQIALVHIKSCS